MGDAYTGMARTIAPLNGTRRGLEERSATMIYMRVDSAAGSIRRDSALSGAPSRDEFPAAVWRGQFNSAVTSGMRACSIDARTTCGFKSRWEAVRTTLARIC